QLLKLWPEDLLDEAPRGFDDNGLLVHPAIPKRADAVAATERDEKLPRPVIRNRKPDLNWRLDGGGFVKTRTNAVASGVSRGLLAGVRSTTKERLDLA